MLLGLVLTAAPLLSAGLVPGTAAASTLCTATDPAHAGRTYLSPYDNAVCGPFLESCPQGYSIQQTRQTFQCAKSAPILPTGE